MGFSSLSSDGGILLDKIGLWELFFSVTFIEKPVFRSSLEVQWLGLPAGVQSPIREDLASHMAGPKKKKKKPNLEFCFL